MDFPTMDREAAEEMWYELFPRNADCNDLAMSLPHRKAACEKADPEDTLKLGLDIAGMARDIVPPLRNMKKIREDFRRNGYNDVAYDHNIPPLARNAVGYRNPYNNTMKNIGRTMRNRFQITENFCVFCRNNGANPDEYNGHKCKNENGLVCCPVLQTVVCPYCQATGPMAHTPKYCPHKPIYTPAYCEAMEQQKHEQRKFSSNKWSNDSRNAPGYINMLKKQQRSEIDNTSGRALSNEDQTMKLYCTHCFRYGHTCWDERGLVCCPFLQTIACRYCKATGKWAHFVKYCPYRPYDDKKTNTEKY